MSTKPEVIEVPVGAIRITGLNDRKAFAVEKLQRLALSITRRGQLNPVILRLMPDGSYDLCAGECRLRAIRDHMHRPTILAFAYAMSDEEFLEIMLAENTGRNNLNAIEEAGAYKTRMDQGWSLERVAATAGVSQDVVERRVRLLALAPDIQDLVVCKQLLIGHAEVLATLKDTNRQRLVIHQYVKSPGMSLDYFKEMVRGYAEAATQDTLLTVENFWQEQVVRLAERPRRGKKAVTGAPTRADLPPVRILGSTDSTAAIIDRHIADLVKAGKTAEAGAVGNLYTALVQWNAFPVPENAELLKGLES